MTVIRFVLLLAVNVSGSLFGDTAVTGTINDFPAGMLALGIGLMAGAPETENVAAARQPTTQPKQP